MADPVGNLPSDISTFVGRRRELLLGKELLGSARLLTLTGTGGIGKTRLARRLAGDSTRAFADGVWFVELADVQHGGFVAATIAATIGLHSQSVDPMTQLVRHLADRTTLLVLDNCEHLVDDCAAVVSDLLAAAPRLRILATSRQVLGVPGEQVYPVPPMSVSPFSSAVADAGPDADSVALFVQRGRAASPDFEVTAANAETVSQICRRLEGVPLAIELAAVRLRTLTAEQILARLDQALDLLVVGPRSLPERQQRIEATIDWSYRLCTPAEQQLWRGLSVFAGGVTLDGLEALGADEGFAPHAMLEALDGLVEKSIVTRTAADGLPRFHLLEVLRQFGHRRLEGEGELDAVHRAHLRFYARLAARGAQAYCSADDYDWMEEIRREQPNLRVAIEYALSTPGLIERAVAVSVGLKPYWTHTGFLQEGHTWLGRAVDAVRAISPTDPSELLTALSAHADLSLLLAQTEPALAMLAECRALASALGERVTPRLRAQIAFVETLAAFFSDGPDSAIAVGDDAIRLARAVEATDPGVTGQTLAIVSICSFLAGSPEAEQRTSDYLAMTEAHGSRLLRAVAIWVLGLCHWRDGAVAAAETRMTEALESYDRFDSQGLVGSAAETLGWTAALAGDDERAAVLFGFVDSVRRVAQLHIALSITEPLGTPVRADVRRRLGERAWTDALRRGAGLSRREGVDLARRATPQKSGPSARQAAARADAGASLTRRESEVAELLAEGLSNKDIAERLVISVRTAEAHVENILVKLNLTSRTQVAAWVRTDRS